MAMIIAVHPNPVSDCACMSCRNNLANHSHLDCVECRKTSPPITDALLQARVDELEALIRQARNAATYRSPITSDDDDDEDDNDDHQPTTRASPFPLNLPLVDVGVSYDDYQADIIPDELISHLLSVFFAHMYQFNFYKSIPDFKRAIQLPPSHPDSPHPCLLSSIYLVACHFSPRNLPEYERILTSRTHRLINEATTLNDRPMDYCMAAVLFSRYCFYTNRFDIGLCYTSSALSFAVGCGFHQITVGNWASPKTKNALIPIPPPRDELETIQRIRMWYSIFILDRGSSWTSGLPPYLADEEITTPWPVNSMFVGPHVPDLYAPPTPTVSALLGPGITAATVLHGDTALSIRAKAIALHDASTSKALAAASAKHDETFWKEFNALDNALTQFHTSLPPISSDLAIPGDVDTSGEDEDDSASSIEAGAKLGYGSRFHTLTLAHTGVLGSMVQLHSIFETDARHRRRMLDAAYGVADVISVTNQFEARAVQILVIPSWASAAQVLLKELLSRPKSTRPSNPSPLRSSSSSQEQEAEDSYVETHKRLNTILYGLRKVQSFYPIAHIYIDRLREGLDRL